MTDVFILEPFGPVYPDLGAAVAKHRRRMTHGLMTAPKQMRDAYADAIEIAIRAKQRAALQREVPSRPRNNCASGTDHWNGEEISKAVRLQHRTALLSYPSRVRRERTDAEWRALYEDAMTEKRRRGVFA